MSDSNPTQSSNASDDDALKQTDQTELELDPAETPESYAEKAVTELPIDAASMFQQALEQTRMAVAISDPHKPDSPLTYVNRAFTELTGYERDEAVGQNCRFLQGPDTDPEAVVALREAIKAREVRVVELLNYRKDGSTFWNSLHVGPIYNDDGDLVAHYGSQWDVTDTVQKRERIALQNDVAEELQHRTRNLFGVISSIVRLSARGESDVSAVVDKIGARIHALAQAHEVSIARIGGSAATDLHDLISTVLRPYKTDSKVRIVLGGEMVDIPRSAVTPIGLTLHELATNALKYGAFSDANGTVAIEWRRDGDAFELTWNEAGGPSVNQQPGRESGTGTRIMEGVLRSIGAELHYEWKPNGLQATLHVPLAEAR